MDFQLRLGEIEDRVDEALTGWLEQEAGVDRSPYPQAERRPKHAPTGVLNALPEHSNRWAMTRSQPNPGCRATPGIDLLHLRLRVQYVARKGTLQSEPHLRRLAWH